MTRVRAAFLALLALLAVAITPLTAQSKKDDDRIYDQVRLKLVNNPDVKGGAIEVKVEDGVVTLSGKVRTERGKDKAERLAGKVKGVKKVINDLTVSST
jgi:osmotically-inducible protein OsmY